MKLLYLVSSYCVDSCTRYSGVEKIEQTVFYRNFSRRFQITTPSALEKNKQDESDKRQQRTDKIEGSPGLDFQQSNQSDTRGLPKEANGTNSKEKDSKKRAKPLKFPHTSMTWVHFEVRPVIVWRWWCGNEQYFKEVLIHHVVPVFVQIKMDANIWLLVGSFVVCVFQPTHGISSIFFLNKKTITMKVKKRGYFVSTTETGGGRTANFLHHRVGGTGVVDVPCWSCVDGDNTSFFLSCCSSCFAFLLFVRKTGRGFYNIL